MDQGINISVRDVGPVEEFSYPLEKPGLHILRGRNGAGKTTILRVLELATTGETETRPTKRDGTARMEAQVGGKRLRISKRVSEEGEVGLESLGGLSIAELHSPAFKSAVTRDKTRIACLVRLAGVKASPELFHHLLRGESRFREVVPDDALRTDDLVEMTARVKRAIEAEARRVEQIKTNAEADSRAQGLIAEGVDRTQPCDQDALQAQLEEAIRDETAKRQSLRIAEDARRNADHAMERLRSLDAPRDMAELEASLSTLETEADAAFEALESLRNQVKIATDALTDIRHRRDAARALVESAERELALRSELTAAINDGAGISPEEAKRALDDATEELYRVRRLVAIGVEVRNAIKAAELSKQHMERAQELGVEASQLRSAAADSVNVLTDAIASLQGCSLKVRTNDDGDARLCLETDRSSSEYFDDLSDGERWVVVLSVASAANRLIVLPQAAFGELSPANRALIHREAVARGCYVVTAQADDGELRAEPFTGA